MQIQELPSRLNSTHIGIFYLLLAVWIAPFAPLQYDIAFLIGDSMEPKYETGDVLIYHENELEDVEEGDVVIFEAQGKQIAHEYIGSGATKGINRERADATVLREDMYMGEVTWKIPTSHLLP